MAIKAREKRLRKVCPLEKQECDPIEHARWEGYNQAFKDITERLREMYKTSPEETQKLLMEHFWDMIE